jgi:hypothetical protein
MATGRVSAGEAFTFLSAYPRPRSLPAREPARGYKPLPVSAPDGYPRISGPQPARAPVGEAPVEEANRRRGTPASACLGASVRVSGGDIATSYGGEGERGRGEAARAGEGRAAGVRSRPLVCPRALPPASRPSRTLAEPAGAGVNLSQS